MDDPLLDRLSDLGAPVLLVPVRHHSPAAADAVRELVLELRPAAVLVEGPSDFNDRIDELDLPHKLPIAIYCHTRASDGSRRGAYYPFCEYSPEWQALMAAHEIGAARRFIDLPYHLADDERQNRYNDAPLRRSPYVERLCARLGVDDFDAAWDDLFEIERLPAATYVRRAHALCRALREADGEVAPRDLRREEFMAAEIRRAAAAGTGPLLVVTGGYHSAGIRRLLDEPSPEALAPPGATAHPGNESDPAPEAGIALTPYSFERLDRLTGYDAGMPGPGFYQRAYQDRRRRAPFDFDRVIRDVAAALRKRKQTISAADLVGVETTARALAALRGHAVVFRRDLVDGFTAAVLKDELARGGSHPLIDAIDEVLRGDARGELAAGTRRPPLVVDLLSRLEVLGLELPVGAAREVSLELETAADRERSAFLHQLRLLGIRGVERVAGTDLVKREDLVRVWERWRLVWTPDFDATAIEAARYGASLEEAAGNVLVERLREIERDAERGAMALVDAALADLGPQARALVQRIPELVRLDGDLLRVVGALRHILFLYRYDRVLGAGSLPDVAPLVAEAWRRGLWLLEGLGAAPNGIDAVLRGVALLVECTEACPDLLPREELLEVLRRAAVDASQSAAVRGAATGALWTLGAAAEAEPIAGVNAFADPSRLGDYLVGLFCLAREAAQRQPELLRAVDRLLLAYDDDEFLEAVPSLRLAFTWFTPREKHHLSLTLLALDGASAAKAPPAPLAVETATAERALAFEARLVELLRRHGLRGGSA